MRMRGDCYSLAFRFLHWSIAFVMLGMLITILLRYSWLNKEGMSEIIMEYSTSQDVNMTKEKAIVLAKRLRAPMWEWHVYLGYTLMGLVFVRIILGMMGRVPFLNPFKRGSVLNTRIRAVIYLLFYTCVVISLVTGVVLKLDIETAYNNEIKSIHFGSIYYFITYLVIHFIGVLFAELSSDNGIVSRMINGKSKYDL